MNEQIINMVSEGINFVIRLKSCNKPKIVNETGDSTFGRRGSRPYV